MTLLFQSHGQMQMKPKKGKPEIKPLAGPLFGIAPEIARERVEELTPREREVAALMATGLDNRVIAVQMGISPKTLDIHRANVVYKLIRKGEPRTLIRMILVFLAGSELGQEVETLAGRQTG